MTKIEVMSLIKVSNTFPNLEQPQIVRENLLNQIEDLINEGNSIIVINSLGKEQSGKTTLLAQFAQHYPDETISIFINPNSKYGYDPEYISFEICNQICWLLQSKQLDFDNEIITDGMRRQWIYKLGKYCRTTKRKLFFVIDGLDQIPGKDDLYKQQIIELLPFGMEYLYFIFSCDDPNLLPLQVKSREISLPGFTEGETISFFIDSLSLEDIREIYRVSKMPGYLTRIKRMLEKETDTAKLIEKLPLELPELFEIEWENVNYEDQTLIEILSILAHDDNNYSIEKLGNLLNIPPTEVEAKINNLEFITVDSQNKLVNYDSHAFKSFAAGKLIKYKERIREKIISYLLEDKLSTDSIRDLPSYLAQSEKYDQLLEYLTPDHFSKLIDISQSIATVQQQIKSGITAAEKVNRAGSIIQFSIQRSLMEEIEGSNIGKSEVEALMSVCKYEEAILLAHNSVLIEDRVQLLCVIVNMKKTRGLEPEPELLEEIRNTVSQLDVSNLGEKSFEIAAELIYIFPDLALELVEKSSDNHELLKNWALARLSIEIHDKETKNSQKTSSDLMDKIRSKMDNSKALSVSTGFSLLYGDYSADQVILEANKITQPYYRLYFLREWIVSNFRRTDTGPVIQEALNLSITSTEITPNIRLYLDLCKPLLYIEDKSELENLLGKIISQKPVFEAYAPTQETVELELSIAEAKSKVSFDKCIDDFVLIYLNISYFEDLDLKVIALANMLSTLSRVDHEKHLEKTDRLHSIVYEDLYKTLQLALVHSHEHSYIINKAISSIGLTHLDLAFQIAAMANTEERRDQAYFELLLTISSETSKVIDIKRINEAISNICSEKLRYKAIVLLLENIKEWKNVTEREQDLIVSLVTTIDNPALKCKALCNAYLLCVKNNASDSLLSSIQNKLEESWLNIDEGWKKIDVGFKIANYLSAESKELALNYIDLTNDFRNSNKLNANSTAINHLHCIDYCIRAFAGLLSKKIDTQEDIDRLSYLITSIPSVGHQALLWAEVIMRSYCRNRAELCKDLVKAKLFPLLNALESFTIGYRNSIIASCSPALYCIHQATTLSYIDKMSPRLQEFAAYNICYFMLTKVPLSEPYDKENKEGFELSLDDIYEICRLIDNYIETDNVIYMFVSDICSSIRNRSTIISKPQIADVCERLTTIINKKLPNPKFIKHEGYLILCKVEIVLTQFTKKHDILSAIDKLIHEANSIPNVSDRAFVLSQIASKLPRKHSNKKLEILNDAIKDAENIASIYDRTERYEDIATVAWDIDRVTAKKFFERAFKICTERNTHDYEKMQQKLIDTVYSKDPDLAASLVSLLDDDPAKAIAKKRLKRQTKILELKNQLGNDLVIGQHEVSIKDIVYYAELCWDLLGSLNAGRTPCVNFNYTKPLIKIADSFPISMAYPIMSYVIENAVKKYEDKNEAPNIIRGIFEATVLASYLSVKLLIREQKSFKRISNQSVDLNERSVIFPPNEEGRKIAKQFASDWIDKYVQDYIIVCDPYFGVEELRVLKLVLSSKPKCNIHIITSKKHLNVVKVDSPRDHLRDYWNKICAQDPPNTVVLILGTEDGEFPIHDRYIITKGAGIHLGTSFNSVAMTKLSSLTLWDGSDAEKHEREINSYLSCRVREADGKRIEYLQFSL